MGMKSVIILLTSFGLLAVSVLSADTLSPVALEIPSATPAQATRTATVTWAAWIATVARVATGIATHTARVGSEPSSPLLDGLVRNKPSIWGNKVFYILLGVLYLAILCLFLKQIIGPLRASRDLYDEFTPNSRRSH
jgi:hypothetical protein